MKIPKQQQGSSSSRRRLLIHRCSTNRSLWEQKSGENRGKNYLNLQLWSPNHQDGDDTEGSNKASFTSH